MSSHLQSTRLETSTLLRWQIFFEAKFKYLVTFEEFGWILHLTVKYTVHENLIRVFFSNATLEDAGEEDEDPYRIVVINTYVMCITIQVTQENVATLFDIPDKGLSDEHVGYLPNAPALPQHDRFVHLFVSHFFWPVGSKHITVRQIDY